jgi:hypothetical protein
MRPIISAPRLLESYKSYNIVRYANYIYGIAQALGELDITQLEEDRIKEYQKIGMWFIGDSIDEIKSLIDKKSHAECVSKTNFCIGSH